MNTKRHSLPQKFLLIVIFMFLWCSSDVLSAEQQKSGKEKSLSEMSIEELMNVEVVSSASLTKTTRRLEPAAVTTITREDIWKSGARSLNELLDIYVPNLQWLRHHWDGDHLALRGIVGDEKYLLLINGQHIEQTDERDLVLLQDIHHIDIVRGSGSALYGPGAISMVINIVTDNSDTFKGTELTSRVGAIEEFYSGELKHGQAFDDNDGGIFFYGGIAKYIGADQKAAPQIFATDFPSTSYYPWSPGDPGPPSLPSDNYKAGEPYDNLTISRDGAASRDLPPLKAHVQIKRGNWDIWGRYTRGGKQFPWDVGPLIRYPYGWGDWVNPYPEKWFYAYQEASGFVGYKQEISDGLAIDYSGTYDMQDRERVESDIISDAYMTNEYQARAILSWDFSEKDKLAFGTEWYHWDIGLSSPGWPHTDAISSMFRNTDDTSPFYNPKGLMPKWSANMYSFLGEIQKTLGERWTTFLGARLDDHSSTPVLFSPRIALVRSSDNHDTLKLLWSRSVRTNGNIAMKFQEINGGGDSKPETLETYEVRYESYINPKLTWAASLFYHSLDLITLTAERGYNELIGTQEEWGIEIETVYHTDRLRIAASHAYTKLIDLKLNSDVQSHISSEPYGYGDDIANWSNHISKISASYLLDDRWTVNGSLRVYWGFPGSKDYQEYDGNPLPDYKGEYQVVEPGWEKTFRGNYYLNTGLQYKPNDNLTVRVDGYYLLGIFNTDFNKREYWAGYGDYRCHAAAVGVSMQYKF